jgi:hypothetical protein
MDLESWSQPGRGLREYFRRVADACGSSVGNATHLGEVRTVGLFRIVLADQQRPHHAVLSELFVCPPPEEVAEFAANPGGGVTTPVTTTEDVFELLSDYAVVRMRPIAG